jgi:acyl-CoA dehydrogenase
VKKKLHFKFHPKRIRQFLESFYRQEDQWRYDLLIIMSKLKISFLSFDFLFHLTDLNYGTSPSCPMTDSLYFRLLFQEIDHRPTNIKDWIEHHQKIPENSENSFEKAVFSGFSSSQLSFAFLSGYEAACYFISKKRLSCVCVTENTKGSPSKSINTRITKIDENFSTLKGEKSFVTFGEHCKYLLIFAKDDEGVVRCVLLNSNQQGIEFESPVKKLNFLNEIPHSKIKLDLKISNEWILKGDGYIHYLKPFRTIEDIHVFGSFLGYFIRVGRLSHWSENLLIKMLKLIILLNNLIQFNLLSPVNHLLLNEIHEEFKIILEQISTLEFHNKEEKQFFLRDKMIFKVSDSIREQRKQSALNSIKSKI